MWRQKSRDKMFTELCSMLAKSICIAILRSNYISKILSFSLSTSIACRKAVRPPVKFTKRQLPEENESDVDTKEFSEVEDGKLDVLLERSYLTVGSGHQVLVIQPYIKWGRWKKRNTTPELQLLESVTLIKTLRQWKVVDKIIISVESFHKQAVFGKGNLEDLKEKIQKNTIISAVFISVSTLSLVQQIALEKVLGVPVFDRYTIIMNIFREHAKTKEAKLQIQLAQLPYLWRILRGINQGFGAKLGITGSCMGGEGFRSLEDRKEVFRRRMAKLKSEILELREQRQMKRKRRDKSEIPVVAVLGYTNAGKTSLIKALTGKKSLDPQNYLFATLDVTSHLGFLPSGLNVFYIDTLGFISDMPPYLIESFISTLEDATVANVIIHVRDVSHPDTVSQNDNVILALKALNLSEDAVNNIITVGNKIDLVEEAILKTYSKDMILVSSTKLTGIDVLREEIQRRVLMTTDKIQMFIRVESGSEEYNWIHEKAVVLNETPDPKNNQYMMIEVIISPSALAKFKHKYIKNYKR